ncbi:MAG: hypothetical protein WBP96_00160 [Nitrososphaeraceae archaeon]
MIQSSAFIHPFAVVIGDCYIGKLVLVAPSAVCRGDEGTPIHVGDSSNMQDGVVFQSSVMRKLLFHVARSSTSHNCDQIDHWILSSQS